MEYRLISKMDTLSMGVTGDAFCMKNDSNTEYLH